jgi:transcriptional regulator with XRE-family HTH domain
MNFDEDFKKAINKYIEPLGRGGQARICDKTGIESTVISAIVNGIRSASELNKHKIANALGYTYDEFLAFGRDELPNDSNKLLHIRRRHDHDPQHSKAVNLLDQIILTDRPELMNHIIGLMESCLNLIRPSDNKRKIPSKS